VGSIPTPGTKLWARGVARLTRLPVTEKIAGSNPVAPARKNQLVSRLFFCIQKHLRSQEVFLLKAIKFAFCVGYQLFASLAFSLQLSFASLAFSS
jgi:hypothetical protein